MNPQQIIGWREWVAFPEWSLKMRAKVDTGAQSSAIDCSEIIELPGERVRFTLRLDRNDKKHITLEQPILRRKNVRSSTGHCKSRIFIEATMRLGSVEKRIVVSLVSRKKMVHRMLLGREALGRDFLVNSSAEHVATPAKAKRKKA
jgi:hypothetical protein